MRWYRKIANAPEGDYSALGDAIEWFEREYDQGREKLTPHGKITAKSSNLPSWVEYYYGVFMEIEAIVKFMEEQVNKATAKWRRHYMEHYNRALSDRMAEKYAEAETEVLDLRLLLNHVLLIRNQFTGLHKGFEYLHFQLGNITKLHAAGIEDAEL